MPRDVKPLEEKETRRARSVTKDTKFISLMLHFAGTRHKNAPNRFHWLHHVRFSNNSIDQSSIKKRCKLWSPWTWSPWVRIWNLEVWRTDFRSQDSKTQDFDKWAKGLKDPRSQGSMTQWFNSYITSLLTSWTFPQQQRHHSSGWNDWVLEPLVHFFNLEDSTTKVWRLKDSTIQRFHHLLS